MSDQVMKQILHELKEMNEAQKEMKQEQTSLKLTQQDMKSQINYRFETLETKVSHMQNDITDIKESVYRIEEDEPQDILAMLSNINQKLENRDSDVEALNKRLFRAKSTLERLTNE